MILEVDSLSVDEIYKLLTGSVLPRPIAWISTLSDEGVPNLAPFSFFTVVASYPPMIGVSIGRVNHQHGKSERDAKDTITNLQSTREFVVNIPEASLVEQVVASARRVGSAVNEFELADVPSEASVRVSPPRISTVPISMECSVVDVRPYGNYDFVVGRVLVWHLRDEMFRDGRMNISKMDVLGRLAGPTFWVGGEVITCQVPVEALDTAK